MRGAYLPPFTIHCVALMHMLFLDSQSPHLELLTAGGTAELMRKSVVTARAEKYDALALR